MKKRNTILICLMLLVTSIPLIQADVRLTTVYEPEENYFEVMKLADFGQTAWGLTTEDFNQDGLLDFAVSYATSPFNYSTISIFYNNGNLDFTRKDVYVFNISYISDLDSGDFDNDGDIDFIFSYSVSIDSSKLSGKVCLLPNDGSNNFGPEIIIIETGSGFETQKEKRINPQLTSADYDGDNDIDILIGDNSGKVEFFKNDGSGSFSSNGIIYDFGFISWGLTSADFNDDGKIDFIVVTSYKDVLNEGNMYLKLNNGRSSCFNNNAGEIIADTHGNTGCLSTMDYNNDGDLDVLAGFGCPYIYNNHEGIYERFLVYNLPNSPDGYGDDLREGAISPGDFNGDGKMDFVAGGVQGVVRLFINNYQEFAPEKPKIEGKTRGIDTYVPYDYTFTASDINEDDVYVCIDWGDETTTDWKGPVASGEKVTISHSWHQKQKYTIRAKAKDVYGKESDWSSLIVSFPKNKAFDNSNNWNLISIKGECEGWSCGTILHAFNFWATHQPMNLYDVTKDAEIRINGELHPISKISDVLMDGFIGISFFPFQWLIYEKQNIPPPHDIFVFGICKQVEIK